MSRAETHSRPLLLFAVLALIGAILVGAAPGAGAQTDGQIVADLSFGGISLWGFDGEVHVAVFEDESSELPFWEGPVDGEVSPEQLERALLPGMVITAGAKDLLIPDRFTFDSFDTAAGLLEGTALDGYEQIEIVLGEGECSGGTGIVDGVWSFEVGDACPDFTLTDDTWADARLPDDEGDMAIILRSMPRFTVMFAGPPYGGPGIEGGGWPYDTPIEITVEDGDGNWILTAFETIDGKTVFGPDQGGDLEPAYGDMQSFHFAGFDDVYTGEGSFRFEPGMRVTVGPVGGDSAYPTKSHTVTSVMPAGVDYGGDIIFGTAAKGSEVLVFGCMAEGPINGEWPWGGAISRLVTAEDGTWTADFSEPGQGRFDLERYREQPACDLSGYEFGATQIDDDFDETARQYLIPQINAFLNAGGWLTIGRVNTEPKLVEILAEPGGDALWSGAVEPYLPEGEEDGGYVLRLGPDTFETDLRPGMVVRVANAEMPAYGIPAGEILYGDLTLAELTMEFDIDDDVVFGTAPGAGSVRVGVGQGETWCSGEVGVEDGAWTAPVADLWTEGEGGPIQCTEFDLTKQGHASVSVEDPTDLGYGFDGEGDRTFLEWETPPQWVKEEIAGFIDSLLEVASGRDSRFLEKALERIDQSLDPSLWVDYRTLDAKRGELVFTREAQAAQELEKIESLTADEEGMAEISGVEIAMALYYAVDLPLLEHAVALAEEAGGTPAWLARAARSQERAEGFIESGDPSAAIVHLGHAWKDVQRAMR